jgi:hypothetical protein
MIDIRVFRRRPESGERAAGGLERPLESEGFDCSGPKLIVFDQIRIWRPIRFWAGGGVDGAADGAWRLDYGAVGGDLQGAGGTDELFRVGAQVLRHHGDE